LHWSRARTFAYLVKGIARETRFFPAFFVRYYQNVAKKELTKRWLKGEGPVRHFDFNGSKLPDISGDAEKMLVLTYVFNDVYLFPCHYGDVYDRETVIAIDRHDMIEGPYGLTEPAIDVTVKRGDIVIDAGAWIGDFSAYAASKGAIAYAFEPVEQTHRLLCETAALGEGRIHPVRKGLGNEERVIEITVDEENSGASSLLKEEGKREQIEITTLDRFVEEHGLPRVDFIKADIEGFEREMLRGATKVLQKFAPKLAICTYHLPNDPTLLEAIILAANPAYVVRHTRHKLFAMVPKAADA
jgi:FkbM family methyltransferase